jgi:NADPH-dependent ferric siderophore reductase
MCCTTAHVWDSHSMPPPARTARRALLSGDSAALPALLSWYAAH